MTVGGDRLRARVAGCRALIAESRDSIGEVSEEEAGPSGVVPPWPTAQALSRQAWWRGRLEQALESLLNELGVDEPP